MRTLFLLPVIALVSFSFHKSFHFSSAKYRVINDSGVINHVLDGLTSEWPDEKFETDKESNIKYAIDNNAENLFLALRVPDTRMQMKMGRQGMNLYIDLKGKKKEGRGIEFPVKRESSGFSGGGFNNRQDNPNEQQGNDRKKGFDLDAMRSTIALNLLFLKLFGFTDDEPVNQGLQTENSANIAFTWDSANVMHIEYVIPLKMLDQNISSLNQKNISIGWKINGVDLPSGGTTTTSLQGRPVGGGRTIDRKLGSVGSGNPPNQADMEKMMKEQSFWTKYTFTIPSK